MIACPVCKSPAVLAERVSAASITAAIVDAMPDLRDDYQVTQDYSLASCSHCSLVFADPMTPGDQSFYGWVCSSRHYYPRERWEWAPLIELLKAEKLTRILDVGCGSGLFLDALRRAGLRGTGIDSNLESVEACRAKGLDVQHIEVEALDAPGAPRFDAVTLFHVIEHLVDPVAALVKLRRLLQPGGVIAVSVPHSPMSFETDFIDPLNRPPHHLTRWNERSLVALAKAAGLDHRIVIQPSRGLLSRTLTTLQVKRGLEPITAGTRLQRAARLLTRLAGNPLECGRIALHQVWRDRELGGAKGDAALIVLSEVVL
jgi:2-polyprenyl-3-methyl-5-hydroxy-6-metoxy-1,4-benzoquinol methylase